jgi:PTH1 family peptidyl-tRNA hydrolase
VALFGRGAAPGPAADAPSRSTLLVVGLGNPGQEYARTRHNVGAEVVERLAARHGGRLRRGKELALAEEVRVDGRRLALAFPQTYVNDSGRSVQLLLKRHDVDDLERLVVVHDELDLPVGALRLKRGGGLAGHNGLRSLRDHLHSTDFLRVRIGVGKPLSKERGADHVLRRVPKAEREVLDVIVERAADAVEVIARQGIDAAMAVYNRADE